MSSSSIDSSDMELSSFFAAQVWDLRFEPDSPVTGPVREQSHVAFHVDSLEEASRGLNCLLGPFTALPGVEVGFYLTGDGAVVELMEYEGDPFNAA